MIDKLFESRYLFAVLPSKIISVDNVLERGYINQKVKLERQNHYSIGYIRKDGDIYNFLDDKSTLYYDAIFMENEELRKVNDEYMFYNIFDGDITLLSDFLYARENNNFIKRIMRFEYPFNPDNMDLNKKISSKLLLKKPFYDYEELNEINKKLKEIDINSRETTIEYKCLKK